MGVADWAVIGVRDNVWVDMGSSCPPVEVGVATLGSDTDCGTLGGLVGGDVGVVVGNVFSGCWCSLASQTTLGDGA